jgi:hypothetical protein
MNVRGYQLIYDKELSRPIWGFSWQRNKNKKRGTNLLTTSILTILFLVFCQSYFLNTYFFMPNLYFNLSFCCLCFTMYRAIFVFSCNYKGIVNRAGKRVFFFFSIMFSINREPRRLCITYPNLLSKNYYTWWQWTWGLSPSTASIKI